MFVGRIFGEAHKDEKVEVFIIKWAKLDWLDTNHLVDFVSTATDWHAWAHVTDPPNPALTKLAWYFPTYDELA